MIYTNYRLVDGVMTLTLRDMCEFIAESRLLLRSDGTFPLPEDIYNYSPTGETFNIFCWYQEALAVLGEGKCCNYD